MPKNVRFDQILVLTGETKILGSTAAEWDAAWTGKMHEALQEVRRLVENGARRGDLVAGDSEDVSKSSPTC